MRKPVLILIILMSFSAFSFTLPAYKSHPVKALPTPAGQDDFTAAFMKYVNGSYYSADVNESFHDLHEKKGKKQKGFPTCLYYATSLEIPDFKNGSIVYDSKDKSAIAFFYHSYKESEMTEGQISWVMTIKWIREALGTNYVEVERSKGNDKNYYFYLPGADTKDEKAWHVMVYNQKYEKSGMGVGFKINAVKK